MNVPETMRLMLASTISGARTRRLLLLAGGGTGGHVFPGLAVADELKARGFEVACTGAADGLEAKVAARRGLPFHPLPARPLVGKTTSARLVAVLLLVRSTVGAWRLIRRLGVSAVLGTGGYLSAPAVLGGFLARRPLLLLEPNAEPGVANRLLSRVASVAAIAHSQAAGQLHCRTKLTGVPVREEFFEQPEVTEIATPFRLLVLGGSQGALRLNRELPPQIVAAFGGGAGTVIHQSGALHDQATLALYRELLPEAKEERGALVQGSLRVEVLPFLDDVARAMGRSHLVISRAGAVTLAELCAVGRASLLVPLPLAGAHQRANARALVDSGAAELCEQDRLSGLGPRLGSLIEDREHWLAMGRRARSLAHPRAAHEIASQLESLVRERESAT